MTRDRSLADRAASRRGRGGPLRRAARLVVAFAAWIFTACFPSPTPPVPVARQSPAPVILVGLDGFRWDYLDPAVTPNMNRLARGGVRAESLVPVFPSKTFPNFYSAVTGLYPEHHGIVSNRFHDPQLDSSFSYDDRDSQADPRWWGGEPIWLTAQRQGLKSATCFWVGSDVEIAGHRPTYWKPYDAALANHERIDQVLAWLDLPPAERPALITLYLSDADAAGHTHGPRSPQLTRAVVRLDRAIGRLLGGLEHRGLRDAVHLVVLSDHGMAGSSPERVILVDEFLDLSAVRVTEWDPVLALWPREGREPEVLERLAAAHPRLRVYGKSELPQRLRYGKHRRIPPVLAIADEGWRVATRRYFEQHPERFVGGMHGYDPAARSMHGIFIAGGPRFRRDLVVPPFRIVHVYALLAELLGVEPAANDGSLDVVRELLAAEVGNDTKPARSRRTGPCTVR